MLIETRGYSHWPFTLCFLLSYETPDKIILWEYYIVPCASDVPLKFYNINNT